jgi:hypothetical protein
LGEFPEIILKELLSLPKHSSWDRIHEDQHEASINMQM